MGAGDGSVVVFFSVSWLGSDGLWSVVIGSGK